VTIKNSSVVTHVCLILKNGVEMRRCIVTIFAIVAIFILSSSVICARALTGGVKVGLNMAKIYGEDVVDEGLDFKMGFCAGGFITLNITEMFAIQPEVLYTQKGFKAEGEEDGVTVKMIASGDYLEIPLLVKLSLPTPGIVKPNLFVGPFMGFNIRAKVKGEHDGEPSPEVDIKDITKDTEFGLVLGGGADFSLPTSKITFDVRYTLGLTTLDDSGYEEDVKNGVISLMVGYSF